MGSLGTLEGVLGDAGSVEMIGKDVQSAMEVEGIAWHTLGTSLCDRAAGVVNRRVRGEISNLVWACSSGPRPRTSQQQTGFWGLHTGTHA